jgi:hypothetical protein
VRLSDAPGRRKRVRFVYGVVLIDQSRILRDKQTGSIGRLADAIADCQRAAANSSDYQSDGNFIEQFQDFLMRLNGDYKEAIALSERIAQRLNVSNTNKGKAFTINSSL